MHSRVHLTQQLNLLELSRKNIKNMSSILQNQTVAKKFKLKSNFLSCIVLLVIVRYNRVA